MLTAFLLALQLGAIEFGQAVTKTIGPGETQSFRIETSADERAIAGTLDSSSDVTITVVGPDGQTVSFFDGRQRGYEPLLVRTAAAGTYRIDVRSIDTVDRRGSYRLRFDAPRAVLAEDELLRQAVEQATEARQLFKKGGREALRQSVALRERGLPIWRRLNERHMVLATLIGAGNAHYRLSDYAPASDAFREALPLARELGDRGAEAEVVNNRGMADWRLGDITGGRQLLEQASAIWKTLGSPDEAIALGNLGIILRQSGDYDGARALYRRSLTIHRASGNRRSQAFALNNLAFVLDDLGRRTEALRHLTSAIRLFREFGDRRAEGRALSARAQIQMSLGRIDAALPATREALALIEAGGDQRAEAEAREHLGRIFAAKGDRVSAAAAFTRALEIFRTVKSPRGESNALHDLGLLSLAAGDAADAAARFTNAIELRRAIAARTLEAESLAQRARAYLLSGELTAAAADADAAVAIAEQVRAELFEREMRTSYASAMQRYYHDYVAILIARHREAPDERHDVRALEIVDRAKARSLFERLRETVPARVDPKLLAREREVRGLLDYWAWQQWERGDQGAAAAGTDPAARLAALAADHSQIEAEIFRADPAASQQWQPAPLALDGLQQRLATTDTAVLAYSLSDRGSYAWVLTADALVVADLPPKREIESSAKRLFALISTVGTDQARRAALDKEAARLSRLVVAPVSRQLGARRLVIVADGMLHNVPFGLLHATPGNGPMLRAYELVRTPSLSLSGWLSAQIDGRSPAPRVLAAIGDPVFDAADPRVAAAATAAPSLERRVSRLPFSREEIERISKLAPSSSNLLALDFDASRDLVSGGRLAGYRYVHFATHAVRDDRRPLLAGIMLSLVNRHGAKQNGFLRLQDIYRLRLRAEVVVLSACETGNGPLGGEGLTTLAHGFLRAGAARVVASLWRVDDEATANLMEQFYRRMLAGTAPAEALRRAQLDLSRQRRWEDPFYWAAWELQGVW